MGLVSVLSIGAEASRALIEETLGDAGIAVTRESFELHSPEDPDELTGEKGKNVIAEIPGSGDGVLLLGAHLDSVVHGPGINDNGSGVGALVEAALVLSESGLASESTGHPPSRSLERVDGQVHR